MSTGNANNEWIVRDHDELRSALQAIQRKRRFSLEDLYHKMGGRLLNRFFQGKQATLASSTLFKAADALGIEIVLREPPKGSKTQKRLDALRKAKEAQQDELLEQAAVEAVVEQTGQDPLTPELRAEVDRMLREFRNPDKLLNPVNGD